MEAKKKYCVDIKRYHLSIRKARAEFIATNILENNNHSKIIFSLLNKMLHANVKGDSPVSSNSQCEELAKFFVLKVDLIYNNFPTDSSSPTISRPDVLAESVIPSPLCSFPPLSLSESESLCLRIKSGSPTDPLRPDHLRQAVTTISPVVRELINLSLSSASLLAA